MMESRLVTGGIPRTSLRTICAFAGAASVLASMALHASPPVQLADVAAGCGGFEVGFISYSDGVGEFVSRAGDVNGDGIPDVIVGAPYADPGGITDAGASYIVFGKADGAEVNVADIAAGIGGFAINGIDPDDHAGSVSDAGDVNGDGLADLIVGAGGADPFDSGEAYVVFGKGDTTPVNLSDVAAGIGGFTMKQAADNYDHTGGSVSMAGDVNGDGLSDVIVGAAGASANGNTDAGVSYVVFGKADGAPVLFVQVAAGIGGFVINGINANDWAGFSVSGAGDVNGDGLDDVIVGAPELSQNGASYLVFGKADGTPVNLFSVAAGIGGFAINGNDANEFSGSSVSGAGDVNADGVSDVIVGAYFASPAGHFRAGRSYVVFGNPGGKTINLSDVAAGNGGFVINGIDPWDYSGQCVSGAGDVNADGLADVMVGAPQTFGVPTTGEAYVVFGKATGTPVQLLDVADGSGGFLLNGIYQSGQTGTSISGAGDLDGDGRPEVIVGSTFGAYVVFSRRPGDFDGNGFVGINDFLTLLGAWGPCPGCPPACPADIDGDCTVGITDFLCLLGHWG